MAKATVHIAAIFSMLFWGMSYIWSKIVFEFYTPLTTIFFRLVISSFVLFVLMFLFKRMEKIKKEDIWFFMLSAVFNPFLYFLFESYGLERVSASISAFIIATIPVFTPVVAYWIFREKLSTVNIIGLVISFVGVILIVFNIDVNYVVSPMGIAFLFMGVFSAVVYSMFLKKLALKYKPMTIIGWQNLIGVIYFIPLVYFFDFDKILVATPSGKAILSLVFLGVFASSFAFALFAFVVSRIGISKANIYSNLIGVFAALASYFILQEKFTAIKLTGMLVIIFGVMLSEIEKRNPFKKTYFKYIKR